MMRILNISSILQFIILLLGFSIGIYFSYLSISNHEEHIHEKKEKYCKIPHEIIDISNDLIKPQISEASIIKDDISGWNLFIKTKNFEFKPENVNKKYKAREGHAHLTINGIKTARIYSNWFHINSLPENVNTVEITLNSNNHKIYSNNGIIISKKILIKTP